MTSLAPTVCAQVCGTRGRAAWSTTTTGGPEMRCRLACALEPFDVTVYEPV